LGFIDNAHPPAAQPLYDAIVRDRLPNHWRESYVDEKTKSTKAQSPASLNPTAFPLTADIAGAERQSLREYGKARASSRALRQKLGTDRNSGTDGTFPGFRKLGERPVCPRIIVPNKNVLPHTSSFCDSRVTSPSRTAPHFFSQLAHYIVVKFPYPDIRTVEGDSSASVRVHSCHDGAIADP